MARCKRRKIFTQQWVTFETVRTECRRWIIEKELPKLQPKYICKAAPNFWTQQMLLDKNNLAIK